MTTLSFNRPLPSFRRRFVPLLGLGLIGVVAFTIASAPTIRQAVAAQPELASLPTPALLALSMISPIVLLLIFVIIGALLTPRIGLRSYVADGDAIWPRLKGELPLAIAGGVLITLVTIALDAVTQPFLPPMKPTAPILTNSVSHTTIPSIIGTLLYGGLTEELLLRWGLMSLVAWIGWKLAQRGQGQPNAKVMWVAIVLSAVLFGVGHLGAVAVVWDLTPLVIVRTVVLNALFGLFAGWLFWRRSLEASMAAHMTGHVIFTLVTLAAVLFQH